MRSHPNSLQNQENFLFYFLKEHFAKCYFTEYFKRKFCDNSLQEVFLILDEEQK